MIASPVVDPVGQIQILGSGRGLVLRGELDLALRRELAAAVDRLNTAVRGRIDLWLEDLRFIDVGCTTEVMKLHRSAATISVHDAPPVFARIVRAGWPLQSTLLS
jgi:hypothetical protein